MTRRAVFGPRAIRAAMAAMAATAAGSDSGGGSISSSCGGGACPRAPPATPPATRSLRAARALRRKAGAGRPAESAGGSRALLGRMRARHHAYAAMHTAARRSAAVYHRNFTIAILTISLAAGLTSAGLQEFADVRWTTFASGAALTLVAGLTAINNFLAFQRREEQHRGAKAGHLRAAGLVDIAFACDDDAAAAGGPGLDFAGVLEELQEIHDGLKNLTVTIPGWVAAKYPEYEAPWLLRAGAGA